MDPAVQLFEATRQQKATDKMDKATTMLLDLFHESYGPLDDKDLSAVEELKAYAVVQPEANALLHLFGLGKLLELSQADPQQLQRWASVRAGRKLSRRRR